MTAKGSAVAPKPVARLSGLSAPRQALVRLCQSIDFGQILDLQIRNREPVLSPPPSVLLDIRLDDDTGERAESELPDFTLRDEVCRLLDRIGGMESGCVQRIEVRAGIPRRVLIEAKITEAAR